MGDRRTQGLLLAAVVIAAVSFILGSYVFPHGSRNSNEVPPAAPSTLDAAGTLGEFGIELNDDAHQPPPANAAPAPPSDGSASAAPVELDAAALEALAEPAKGRLTGRVIKRNGQAGTVVVSVLEFRTVVPGADGTPQVRTLPRGATLTLVMRERPPGAPERAALEPGQTVRAEVRIEPSGSGRPGRIVAVNIEAVEAR